MQDLVLEDLQDGDVRMGGSFRGAFSNADKGESYIKVITFVAVNLIYCRSSVTIKNISVC